MNNNRVHRKSIQQTFLDNLSYIRQLSLRAILNQYKTIKIYKPDRPVVVTVAAVAVLELETTEAS